MEHIVTRYFAMRLEELGYPTEDVGWSLGYCQGDGMAFYGHISGDDLKKVANRLFAGAGKTRFELLAAAHHGCSVEISRNDYGHHYSHFNTMALHNEVPSDGETDARFGKLMDDVIPVIEEDVRSISRKLADDGYTILEAMRPPEEIVREVRTKCFLLRIREKESEMYYDYYPDNLDDFQSIILGQERCADVVVELYELDEDGETAEKIASSVIGSVWMSTECADRFYGGYLRDAVSDVIKEARATLGLEKSTPLQKAA